MPKQVRHDSLVWVRWGKKVEKYTRCRNKFGMTFKKRGDIPTSTPHPQQKPPWFSPSPDAHASPSPLKGEEEKTARYTPIHNKSPIRGFALISSFLQN